MKSLTYHSIREAHEHGLTKRDSKLGSLAWWHLRVIMQLALHRRV